VDDEPLARERLGRLLREAGCKVLAEIQDGHDLKDWISGRPVADAIFMDIQMPGGNGLEILAELTNPPPVVFVTAHSEYAIRAFDMAAVDYLLKPVFEDRLARTLDRLRAHQVRSPDSSELKILMAPSQRFLVKAGVGHLFLELKRVSHFQIEDEIVWAWAGGRRFRTQWTALAEVEATFPESGLMRIQRNILLRPETVIGFRPLLAGRIAVRIADGIELEVSRTMTPRLKQLLGLG
jgi:two-component system LytT family response regulator/two-component system response regulator AlgR